MGKSLRQQRQKEVYKFFGLKVPAKLKHKDAESFIKNLFEDEEKLDAWDKHEQEIDERESLIEENYEMFDLHREYHECKKNQQKIILRSCRITGCIRNNA